MGIEVHVNAGHDLAESAVQAIGAITRVVTAADAEAFKVNPTQLKAAFTKYHTWATCKAAYLKDPTGHPQTYKSYNEPEVQMVLMPTGCRILDISKEPVIVKTAKFVNESGSKATFHVEISDQVTDSVTSSWSTGGQLTVEQAFQYGVTFLGTGGQGTTTVSYTQQWGVGGEHSKQVTVGSTTGVDVELEPGKGVIAELAATRGKMRVQVDYNAYLTNRAMSFESDGKTWRSPINNVMTGTGIPNSIKSTETLEVGYYSDSVVIIRDLATQSVITQLGVNEESSEPLLLSL